MTRLGLVHTVPALADSFGRLLEHSGAELVHTVDPTLLSRAIDHGVDDGVRADVLRHVTALVDGGADAVLVTCSSIGEAVEEAAARLDVPVLRVDAPMAREAVELAAAAGSRERTGRIAVLATLEATLGPTGRLLDRAVAEAVADIGVDSRIVPGAAAARSAGDSALHDRLVREAVEEAAAQADVIVLAQASMAAAVEGAQLSIPVLTSPESGAAALLNAAVPR